MATDRYGKSKSGFSRRQRRALDGDPGGILLAKVAWGGEQGRGGALLKQETSRLLGTRPPQAFWDQP